MTRRRVLALVAGLLVAAGLVTWRVWPRDPGPVAPELSARLMAVADHRIQGHVTLVGGGSRSEAHRLWARYHDQDAYQGVKPRLLGISLVHVASNDPKAFTPSGDYWVVFCDQAWQPNLGGQGDSPGGYSREIVLVHEGSRSTSGNIVLF